MSAAIFVCHVFFLFPQVGADQEELFEKKLTELTEAEIRERVDAKVRALIADAAEKKRKQFERLAAPLKRKVAEFDRLFELTEKQKRRLDLGIRGAVKRYLEEADAPHVSSKRAGFTIYHAGNTKYIGHAVHNAFVPLESIWIRAVQSTLSKEQHAVVKAEEVKRRAFRRNSIISAVVMRLDSRLQLSSKQREALTKLLDIELREEIDITADSGKAIGYFLFRAVSLEDSKFDGVLGKSQIESANTMADEIEARAKAQRGGGLF